MKKNKIFKLLLLILILIFAFLTIRNTYSKYITQSDSNSNFNISRWNIKINNEDIEKKTDFSEDLKVSYLKDENIAEGVVVPTSKGTFELSLESTGTDLPFEYEISFAEDKPYSFVVNSVTPGDNITIPYLYDISISVTNTEIAISPWTLTFDTPENLVADSCTIVGVNSYNITNNKVTLESTTTFAQDETKTLNLVLAVMKEINFEISNVTLNGNNFDVLTDRISDFRVTSYTLNGSEIFLPTSETTIKGTVTPSDDIEEEVINEFIFTAEWYDGADNVLDNFEDVKAYKSSLPATLPVSVKITQILEETQTP